MVKKRKLTKTTSIFDAFDEDPKNLYNGAYTRQFIGHDARSLASVRWEVRPVTKGKYNDWSADLWSADLTFSDGYSAVTFDFGSWQERDGYEDPLARINRIIETLGEFRDEMAAANETCRVKKELEK